MSGIDKYAYNSRISDVKASSKLLFALSMMLVCLAFSSDVVSLLIIVTMSAATVLMGGYAFGKYIKLLSVPLAFLVTGVITVIINRLPEAGGALISVRLFGGIYGVSYASLKTGINIFLKSFGAVTCLYFFSLNTPMNSFLSLLRRKAPGIFVELMELTYRFIFIVWDEAQRMHTAQASRLGYEGFRNSMSSLGELAATVFIRALRRVDRINVALESRGFEGNFDFLTEEEKPSGFLNGLTAAASLAFISIGIFERLQK